MPLTKAQKALYEAALRRKGLPLEKMRIQHITPNTYGPFPADYDTKGHGPFMRSYWNSSGRYQDLEDELSAAARSGRYQRPENFNRQYWRWYNDGDYPSEIIAKMPSGFGTGEKYEDPSYTFKRIYEEPRFGWRNGRMYRKFPSTRRVKRELTELGEMEMEAIADQQVVEEYKDYLRRIYEGELQRPRKYGVKVFDRMTHEPLVSEYDELDNALKALRRNRDDYGSAYLEEIWPEE